MSKNDNAPTAFPPPWPLVVAEEARTMPPRPWIVWAYFVTEVVAVTYGTAFDVLAREQFSLFNFVCSLGISAIAVLVIWNASHAGWVIFVALAILFLPFTLAFLDQGAWGKGIVVIQIVSLCILVSPWMFRWIWRDGRPLNGDVEHVLARTAEAVSLSSPEVIPLDPSWQRPGGHIELAGEVFAFPLWVDGGTIHEEKARDIGISEQTIQRLTEFSHKWDETFEARQTTMPLPTWEAIDKLGHWLAVTIAEELDDTWTVHFLSLHDKRSWAWAGGSAEQVYPS